MFMSRQNPAEKGSKTPVLFWILLVVCALATVALLAFVALRLLGGTTPAEEDAPSVYTQQEREDYFFQFDAAALAAAVCQEYPGADRATMAYGMDERFLRMTVEQDGWEIPLHFSLRGTDMAFTDEFPGYDRGFVYTSLTFFDVLSPGELAREYRGHLEALGCQVTGWIKGDLDGDGVREYVCLVKGVPDRWLEDAYGGETELEVRDSLLGKTVCLYLDQEGANTLRVHGFWVPDPVGSATDALWDNGMLHLMYNDGQVWRLFVSENREDRESTGVLRQLCARYATYLEDRGYTDVHMRLADVSTAPGPEVLCCFSDGSDYTAVVYAVCDGRFQELYSKRGAVGAVYLVQHDGGEYLFDYSQTLSADYSQSYAYCLFRFDGGYARLVADEDWLQVEADQGGGQTGSGFFARVQSYLKGSVVCYDPYALTGYKVMQDSGSQDAVLPQSKYLRIDNCSTNKVGVVTLRDDDSWLNFRNGPSTGYDMVLIDPHNPQSYVKQVQGSLVTVVMPHNTGDRENPIWAQIQISYRNRTMEGYSSQRYIHIDGIRHLAVGERFTVTADTNDTGLYWTSSDPQVASIDPATGMMTAHSSGLVLVTVVSDTGLEDSCLIMID